MESLDAQQLVMAGPLLDQAGHQPARFDPEDLVHLSALLNAAPPRNAPPTRLQSRQDHGARRASPPTTAQMKEEKQRAKYRNRYHNRIATLQRLRDDVTALTSVVHQLSGSDAKDDKDVKERSASIDALLTPRTAREDLIVNLQQALVAKQCLQRERAQLRQQFIESCDRWRHVNNLVAMHHKLYVATQSSFVMVKPLTASDCDQLREEGLEMRDTLLPRHSQLSESICGWSAFRSIDDRVLSFSIQKTYFNRSVDFFAPIMWRLLSDPKLGGSIFAPALQMQVRVVQQIDSNNLVLLNEYVETGANGERIKVKILYLLSQKRTDTGYVQVVHTLGGERLDFLEHPQPTSSNERIMWNAQHTWVQLERSGAKGEHTIVRASSCIPMLGTDLAVWFTMLYQILLRWDTVAFGTRFSLPK